MNSKKTGFMWFVIAIVFISMYQSFNFVSQNVNAIQDGTNIALSISAVASLIWLLIAIKYLRELFLCKKGIFLWTNIYWGLGLIISIGEAAAAYLSFDSKIAILIPIIIFFAIRIAIWIGFYRHLKSSQLSGAIVLN
jgi:hypothetical protein